MLMLPLAVVPLALLTSCGGGSSGGGAFNLVTVSVVNHYGAGIVGATVYLVPATDVDQTPFDAQDVLDGVSEAYDEPLEDAIRLNGAGYLQAVTGANGKALITGLVEGKYFFFAMPAATDTEHLPGGSLSRVSQDWTEFRGTTVEVTLTGSPSATADYVGTSTCLVCHASYASEAKHAHKLGFAVPGQLAALQDISRYPEYTDNWDAFTPAANYMGGTEVWYSDFDPTRGFDKFKTSMTDPTGLGETVYVKAYLWQDTTDNNKYKLTLENIINPFPADAMSPWTVEVKLTYGGAVYKQRNLVAITGRKGLYPLLQYQTDGDDSRYDRTRKVFRDYHLDWYWDKTNQLLQLPANTKNFDGNCTGCHATGFERYQDPGTLEYLTHAVDDAAGAFDIDGDGSLDEINVGCEVCHGPGSDHQIWAADPVNAGMQARYIVEPELLSASRESLICGRCHDRVSGQGPVINDEPLNAAGLMPLPGIGREAYLASYVTRNGPKTSSMWGDEIHSKSHHQQYSDLIKSPMHRNDRILTTCTNCHEIHGNAPFEHHLKSDPNDPESMLCASCHAMDLSAHMIKETGATHAGNQTSCTDCHMTKAAKTGAGGYEALLGAPTGTASDPSITYFTNDITSHLFLSIPKKDHVNVAGVVPGSAMPIPYTNACGTGCHTVSGLQFQSPLVFDDQCSNLMKILAYEPDGFGSTPEQDLYEELVTLACRDNVNLEGRAQEMMLGQGDPNQKIAMLRALNDLDSPSLYWLYQNTVTWDDDGSGTSVAARAIGLLDASDHAGRWILEDLVVGAIEVQGDGLRSLAAVHWASTGATVDLQRLASVLSGESDAALLSAVATALDNNAEATADIKGAIAEQMATTRFQGAGQAGD